MDLTDIARNFADHKDKTWDRRDMGPRGPKNRRLFLHPQIFREGGKYHHTLAFLSSSHVAQVCLMPRDL